MRVKIAAGVLSLLAAAALLGCGRKGPPLPPEAFAPHAVRKLEVRADLDGVRFFWEAPERDRHGEELESIDGYQVMRKEIIRRADILDKAAEFDELEEIPDTHLEMLERLRDEARDKGMITRRIQVDRSLREFEYVDSEVQPGATYLYKIIPVNQGGVEGEVAQLIQVRFRGDSSEVRIIEESSFEARSF